MHNNSFISPISLPIWNSFAVRFLPKSRIRLKFISERVKKLPYKKVKLIAQPVPFITEG